MLSNEQKQQIEDEALRRFPFIKAEHLDTGYPYDINHERRAGFVHGAKFGYNIKESVDEKLLRQVQRLTTWLRMEGNNDDVHMILEADKVTSEAESILSASQNTVSNEGEKCDCTEEYVCGICFERKGYAVRDGKLELINPPKEK